MNSLAPPRNWRALTAIFAALAFALFVASANGQMVPDPVVAAQGGNPMGMLIVYLQGDDGKPVTAMGVVTLFRAGEVSGPNQRTDASGVVRFTQLANAHYTITVSVAGYMDQRLETEITPNQSLAQITVTLSRANGDAPSQPATKGVMLAPKAKKEAQKGIDAMRTGDYAAAQQHLSAALDLAPGNPDLNDRMGELFIVTKDFDKAQTYLAKALSLEPENAGALTDMGWLRVQQGNNADAESELQRAVVADPQRWFTHWLLGVAYLRQQKFEAAHDEAVAAMKTGKGAALDAEYLLGESLAALGRNEEAIKALQNLIAESPDGPTATPAKQLLAKLKSQPPQAAPEKFQS